jgi:alkylation response protein AidB-like acyl-CoA dehydrogenase
MHASWVASQAQIIDNGVVRQRNGVPELRFMFMPKAEVQVLDTWKTRGMRGTGTHHFEVKDVFVPEARSVYTRGAARVTDGTRYRIPTTLIFLGGDAAVGLAVARSCIDAFCELAGGKSPRHMTGLLRDQPVAQYNVGQCDALQRSARAFLMEAVGEIWDGVSRNGELTLQQRATMRLAGTHAIRTAVQIVQSIYADCGATAIFEGNVFHRLFQDIHVITQHLQSRRGFYEMIGKFHMGLPIDEARL